MLTIICGEDSVGARNYFNDLKNKYQQNEFEIKNITVDDILEIPRGLADSPSLFAQKRIFFVENLNKKINKKTKNKLLEVIGNIILDKTIELIAWEDNVPQRMIKLSKNTTIKEFKPSQNIFQLLDSCFPTNLRNFIALLQSLPENFDDVFIFIMFVRHMRNLVLIKNQTPPKTVQFWQIKKYQAQANFWSSEKLLNFYEALCRLDMSIKTSKNPFSIRNSLNLLACYYL